jgi:hypothetical protein
MPVNREKHRIGRRLRAAIERRLESSLGALSAELADACSLPSEPRAETSAIPENKRAPVTRAGGDPPGPASTLPAQAAGELRASAAAPPAPAPGA